MKSLKIFLLLSLIPLAANAANHQCTYTVDTTSTKVSWTAFKTTEKTPVSGTLKDVTIKAPLKGTNDFKKLLVLVKAAGSIDNEVKSDSGNPARDLTLFQKFFSLIKSNAKFEGSFKNMKGNDQEGEMNLILALNGKTKYLPMKYTFSKEGNFETVGEFDLNDFGLSAALASIHQACETLHKGKDGISKTWPNVGLKISFKISKDCTQ